MIPYESNAVREAALQAGFTTPLNTANAPILHHDTPRTRSYVVLSGGRGAHYARLPARVGGPSTVYKLLTRSAEEQWRRDHHDEWTLTRETPAGTEYIDHYVGQGVTRFTAGRFHNTYPSHTSSPGTRLERKTRLPAQEHDDYTLTTHDKRALELRDHRWSNFYHTKRTIDRSALAIFCAETGIISATLGLLAIGAIDNANMTPGWVYAAGTILPGTIAGRATWTHMTKKLKKEHKATKITLDNILFNEDVIAYLETQTTT